MNNILIESGAYVSKQNNNVHSPSHFAIEWSCKDVINFSSSNTDSRTKMKVGKIEQIRPVKRLKATSAFLR
ncbi:MAG: hypothetical protein ACR5KV_04530 [Wolbachia sp.]